MIEAGRLLKGSVAVHLVGHADAQTETLVMQAHKRGEVVWHGYLPNAQAMELIRGATVGLSLLRDEPNYRHSRPTKIMEYLAHGVPVVSTPLPLAVAMLDESAGGVIVPFDDPQATASAVSGLAGDDEARREMAQRGHRWVKANADWNVDGPAFVSLLAGWARSSGEHHPDNAP